MANSKSTFTDHGDTEYIYKLECELSALSSHAFVIEEWMENLFRRSDASKSLEIPDTYLVTKETVDATLFLIYDLKRRIDRVRGACFAIIEAGAISQDPAQPSLKAVASP